MIKWILQGIFRDKTRSLFPFLVVTVGVSLVVFFIGFMEGIFMGMIDLTSHLDIGHLRLLNKPFYEEEYLNPLDRALAGQEQTQRWLHENTDSRIDWSPRIRWGAILDVPDEQGETKTQTPVMGLALDLTRNSAELGRLKLSDSLTQGRLPSGPKEMLVGYELAKDLEIEINNPVTLIGQSFDGGLAMDNYTVVGFVRFGIFAMDKKMALIDLADAQDSFYMQDMVTEWLGFLPRNVRYPDYQNIRDQIRLELPGLKENPPADWARDDEPIVLSFLDQRNMANLAATFELVKSIIIGIFLFLMVLVLWNAGLQNGIHRYGEMGLRLALGETHAALVFWLCIEALAIGFLGSLAGCLIGGGLVYYLQEVGVNMGDAFAQTGLMLNDVQRARMTVEGFIYGVVPGMTASLLGSLMASISIFKRSEANLFRELEAG